MFKPRSHVWRRPASVSRGLHAAAAGAAAAVTAAARGTAVAAATVVSGSRVSSLVSAQPSVGTAAVGTAANAPAAIVATATASAFAAAIAAASEPASEPASAVAAAVAAASVASGVSDGGLPVEGCNNGRGRLRHVRRRPPVQHQCAQWRRPGVLQYARLPHRVPRQLSRHVCHDDLRGGAGPLLLGH